MAHCLVGDDSEHSCQPLNRDDDVALLLYQWEDQRKAGLFILGADTRVDIPMPIDLFHVCIAITMHRANIGRQCAAYLGVRHESFTVPTGCSHSCLPVAEILSQTDAQARHARFVRGDGSLRGLRCSFAQKRKYFGRREILLQ